MIEKKKVRDGSARVKPNRKKLRDLIDYLEPRLGGGRSSSMSVNIITGRII